MRVENRAGLSAQEITALETEIAGQENLRDVLRWAQRQPNDFLPPIVADVIVQDEFTHDVIIPWREVFLVYDTT